MRKRISKSILTYFAIAVIVCTTLIAYARIQNIDLSITGRANATGVKAQDDFKVKFNSFIVDNNLNSSDVTITGALDDQDEHKANFTVTGLVGYGDHATISYEVLNYSNYFSANLTTPSTIVNTNSQYFSIEKTIVDNSGNTISKINPGGRAYLKITVKVIKVPTSAAQTADVTVYLNAESEPYTGG